LLRRKVEKKVENRREEVRRGKDREEGKSSRRKLFIACVSLYWFMRVLPLPQSAAISNNVSPKLCS